MLSQIVGKAYTAQHQQPAQAQQVTYAAAPSTQYVTSAAHGSAQQVAYNAPVQHFQIPQVQYVTAPQAQHSTQRFVYALPQQIAYTNHKGGVHYA